MSDTTRDPRKDPKPEGWTFLHNARKWHYFRNSRALCGRWMYLGPDEDLEQGNDESKDNCPTCVKKLLKEREKAANKAEIIHHAK